MRWFAIRLALAGLAVLSTTAASAQVSLTGLVSDTEARRLGMVRAWAIQVGVGGGRDSLAGVVPAGDVVVVYTQRGVLQAIDAERGATRWIRQIGGRQLISYAPAVDAKHVAVVHGRNIYLLDRNDGRELWRETIEGVPSAPPALSPERVFVPTMRGKLVALKIADPGNGSWFFSSTGAIEVSPLVTPSSVLWATTAGLAFCSALDQVDIRFQLETRAPISAPMAFQKPMVYIASQDEEIYAIDEMSGDEHWRHATGGPISRAPLVAGDILLVTPDAGALHCLGAAEGELRWAVRRIAHVAAVGPQRVYAIDTHGRLAVIHRVGGGVLGRLETSRMSVPIINTWNDRVFLASPTGLVQCLRGETLLEPARVAPEEPEKPAGKPAAKPAEKTDDEAEEAAEET